VQLGNGLLSVAPGWNAAAGEEGAGYADGKGKATAASGGTP